MDDKKQKQQERRQARKEARKERRKIIFISLLFTVIIPSLILDGLVRLEGAKTSLYVAIYEEAMQSIEEYRDNADIIIDKNGNEVSTVTLKGRYLLAEEAFRDKTVWQVVKEEFSVSVAVGAIISFLIILISLPSGSKATTDSKPDTNQESLPPSENAANPEPPQQAEPQQPTEPEQKENGMQEKEKQDSAVPEPIPEKTESMQTKKEPEYVTEDGLPLCCSIEESNAKRAIYEEMRRRIIARDKKD